LPQATTGLDRKKLIRRRDGCCCTEKRRRNEMKHKKESRRRTRTGKEKKIRKKKRGEAKGQSRNFRQGGAFLEFQKLKKKKTKLPLGQIAMYTHSRPNCKAHFDSGTRHIQMPSSK
jgi:hypothetical protein